MNVRAGAAVSLTGPLAIQGRDAAAGLRAWSSASGIPLLLRDDEGDPERVRGFYAETAGEVDILFGPYGSGLTRAAVGALADAGAEDVLWNHGGAAIDRPTAARVVDVLAPAGRYWTGLAPTLAKEAVDLDAVVLAHGPTPFGRAIGEGARRSLADAGAEPMLSLDLTEAGADETARQAVRAGASAIAGGASLDADLRLAEACDGSGVRLALVGLGISEAHERLGDAVIGGIGPAQWLPGASRPDTLGAVSDYPGAQAFAAGLLAEKALAQAGAGNHAAVWNAARSLTTTTFLGPFSIDTMGRQLAHAPLLVRWVSDEGGLRRVVAWSPG